MITAAIAPNPSHLIGERLSAFMPKAYKRIKCAGFVWLFRKKLGQNAEINLNSF